MVIPRPALSTWVEFSQSARVEYRFSYLKLTP